MTELEVPDKNIEKKFKPNFHYVRVFGCVGILLAVFIGGGVYLYKMYDAYAKANQAKVQAEISKQLATPSGIVLPSTSTGDPLADNPQTQAVVPFNKTVFTSISNAVYHFSMVYPSNTTYIQRSADGDELWFLRRSGYMFKVNIYPVTKTQTAASFVNTLNDKSAYTASNAKLNGMNSMLLTQIDTTAQVVGNEYVLKAAKYNEIFVIWYQIYPDNRYPDDAQRIQTMLKSFRII